jgi:glycosyltransferase involved in cell wall biosynthesis
MLPPTNKLILSICIPSYNRPESLLALLSSVDCSPADIEIVIAEDNAPRRKDVREKVQVFQSSSPYLISYHENESNLGFDANLRQLTQLAAGDYLLFMGDDDLFKCGALNLYISFLKKNQEYNYILRSYEIEHHGGSIEKFKYFPTTTTIPPGEESACFLFKRSVSIAGFTIKRETALKYRTDQLDGTLLFQLYWVLNIAYREKTIFCDIPVAKVTQSFRNNDTSFGTAENEKRFTPGKISQENSIRFTAGFFEIAESFDRSNHTKITNLIRKDLSRYAYPILSIQRKNGFIPFVSYVTKLSRRTGINQTWHFYFYSFALLFFGEKICDRLIVFIKNRLGYTPQL